MKTISISKDIEPLSDFRKNAAAFLKRLKSDKKPIVLTQHGKSAAVLLDVSEYDRIVEHVQFLEAIIDSKKQVEKGLTFTAEETRLRIGSFISKWK
jgi:prevent-host-death family protein